eukprot:8158424-Lingulodinium_polyedra.AAC.1
MEQHQQGELDSARWRVGVHGGCQPAQTGFVPGANDGGIRTLQPQSLTGGSAKRTAPSSTVRPRAMILT